MPSKPFFKCALITGSTSGLGKALGDFLETQGTQVLRTGSKSVDLSIKEERKKLLHLLSETLPDLIVNNAGIGLYGACINHSVEEQLKIVEVNCNALMEISLHATHILRKAKKQATILNISSVAGFFSFPTLATYCASKAFVINFSLALDEELKTEGIRVLCACPGPIHHTNFRVRASKGFPQQEDPHAMTLETAVGYLWKQLKKKRPLYVFGVKTRAFLLISRLLPRCLLNQILKQSLKNRYRT